jgi:hypothetical protein
VAGDGVARYAEEIYTWTGHAPAPARATPPDGAAAAALLDLAGWEGGLEPVGEAALAEPDYGRPAEAQARWEAAHGRPLPDPARDAG